MFPFFQSSCAAPFNGIWFDFDSLQAVSFTSLDNVEPSGGGHGKIVAWITPLDIPTAGDAIRNVLGITEITTTIGTVVAAFLSVNTMAKAAPSSNGCSRWQRVSAESRSSSASSAGRTSHPGRINPGRRMRRRPPCKLPKMTKVKSENNCRSAEHAGARYATQRCRIFRKPSSTTRRSVITATRYGTFRWGYFCTGSCSRTRRSSRRRRVRRRSGAEVEQYLGDTAKGRLRAERFARAAVARPHQGSLH